jgi:hypothetical protein
MPDRRLLIELLLPQSPITSASGTTVTPRAITTVTSHGSRYYSTVAGNGYYNYVGVADGRGGWVWGRNVWLRL